MLISLAARAADHSRRLAALTTVLVVAFVGAFASSASAMSPAPTSEAGVVSVLRSNINGYWAQIFAGVGRPYGGPAVGFYNPGSSLTSCGWTSNPSPFYAENSFYCPPDRAIWLDTGWNQASMRSRGDYAAGVIFAHEWAHHVQMWRGLNRAAYATFRWELMADCLAGMSTRHGVRTGVLNGTDFYEGQNELYALGDYAYSSRDHHGTPAQRKAWYTYGYNNAYNLYTCDPALSAAL